MKERKGINLNIYKKLEKKEGKGEALLGLESQATPLSPFC
jgi:hypothetical protein